MKTIIKRVQVQQLHKGLSAYPIVDRNKPTPLEKSIMDQCKFLERKIKEVKTLDDKAHECMLTGVVTNSKEYSDAALIFSKIADDIVMDI